LINSSFLSLVQNASLLLAMALVFDTTMRLWRTGENIWKKLLLGIVVGLIGVALMNTPWIYGEGLIFDTRSILLCLSGLFFGAIPTLVAMVITAVYRFSLGGAYITGISVIVATGLMGITWRHVRVNLAHKKPLIEIKWWQLYFFGFIVHIVMLLLMFTQSMDIALPLISSISLPILTIYPVGCLLLGLLMINRMRREESLDEIKKSRERLSSMVDVLQYPENESSSFINFAMEEAIKLTESQLGFIFYYSEETKLFTLSSWSKSAMEQCSIDSPPIIYELDKTGVWGEPVRQRRPIILNDFQDDNSLKKGYPEGHPNIERLLEIPIFSENQIVAVVGMANKASKYDEIDVVQLTLLMESVWKADERKKAIEALRNSEENYRHLFNQSADGIFISTQDGNLLDVNQSGCTMLGYSPEELIANFNKLLKDTDQDFDFEKRKSDLQKGQSLLTERKFTTKNGRQIDLEILSQVLPDGRVQKVVRDITERKKTEMELQNLLKISDDSRKALLSIIEDQKEIEEALRRSEQSYHNLFENITQGFAVHKIILNEKNQPVDFQFLAANPAYEKLTQMKEIDIVGKTVKNIQPKIPQKWIDLYGNVALTGKPVKFEDHNPILNRFFEIIVFCPEPGYFAVVMSDITARKKYELEIKNFNIDLERKVRERTTELQTANHELESFSYTISHDLRAPLRSINGFSQIVLDEYSEQFTPELTRYFELIRKNATMMGNLVDDLLNFSRLGRQALEKTTVDPVQIVNEVIDSLQTEIGNRDFDVSIRDMPECEADPVLLRQVFVNLITNAIKFTNLRENPRIEIGYLDDQKQGTDIVSCYFVRDNGVGFDMKFYDKLFGVFQRLHRAEDYEGTGVGLAIVDRIVRKHGGKVWATAEINKGATFYFTLGESENGN